MPRFEGYVPPTRPENWDDNCIPPMTHPDSSGWTQPDISLIAITTLTATMSKETFDELLEYSGTNPSGVYEGKMWKRHDGSFDGKFLAKGGKPVWQLCWFSYSKIGPGYVLNERREIILSDADIREMKG